MGEAIMRGLAVTVEENTETAPVSRYTTHCRSQARPLHNYGNSSHVGAVMAVGSIDSP